MNVIILLVDTLRADHLDCYGYSRDTSPHLDTFAKDAVRFENVTSQAPWTSPSVASLLSSLYPSAHGLVTFKEGNRVRRLAESVTTLGQVLEANGYQTAAFVANPFISPRAGLDRGFAVFRNFPFRDTGEGAPAPELNDAALTWLNTVDAEPFFLFLHYMDVHGPYLPPAPYRTMFNDPKRQRHPMTKVEKRRIPKYLRVPDLETVEEYIDLYDGQIRFWDDRFEEFMNQLDAGGFLDNTMVVVTSDHGEEFLEHGGFNHGGTLYEEQIRVPLVWKLPTHRIGPSVVEAEVELVDVAPTILALTDIEAIGEMQGDDLRPLFQDGPWEARPAFSEAAVKGGGDPLPAGEIKAVRSGNIKTIVNLTSSQALTYDLDINPGENVAMAQSAGRPTEAGRTAIDEWFRTNKILATHFLPGWSDIEPAQVDQLEALGYIER